MDIKCKYNLLIVLSNSLPIAVTCSVAALKCWSMYVYVCEICPIAKCCLFKGLKLMSRKRSCSLLCLQTNGSFISLCLQTNGSFISLCH